MKVLVIESGGLGDFVSTMPAIKLIGEKFSDAKIIVKLPKWYASFARNIPYIHEVLEMNPNYSIIKTVHEIRKDKYDLVINFHPARKNTIFTLLARGRRKVGYFVAMSSEHYSYRANHFAEIRGLRFKSGKIDPGISLYERALIIARLVTKDNLLFITDPYIKNDLSKKSTLLLERLSLSSKKFVTLHPFSSKSTKNWPSERIKSFIDLLALEFNVPVLILGSEKDLIIISEVIQEKPGKCILLTPPMEGLAEILSKSLFFVGVDSGPLHIAVSSGLPAIGLFGRTAPTLAFPKSFQNKKSFFIYKNYQCKCSYNACIEMGMCMSMITAEEVIEAAKTFQLELPNENLL